MLLQCKTRSVGLVNIVAFPFLFNLNFFLRFDGSIIFFESCPPTKTYHNARAEEERNGK